MKFEKLPMSAREYCSEDFFLLARPNCLLDTIKFENYEIGMHRHEFYEINIVFNGSGIHYIQDNMYKIGRGNIFVIPPNLYHGYKNINNLEVYHILVSKQYISRYIAELECMEGYINLFSIDPVMRSNTEYSFFLTLDDEKTENLRTLTDILDKIRSTYREENPDNCDLLMNSMGLNVIETMCHYYETTSPKEKPTKNHKKLSENIQFICNNYDKKLTLKMLAENVNMSQSAYVRLFNSVFKVSPMQYVINYRLSRAKYMLANTDMTVTDIACRTGFYDSAHLNKIFLSLEGICPSEYRNNKKTS